MLIKIIPTLALAGALALAGCSALDTQAETERMNAQARADNASAQLVAAQAMSATLSAQAAQTERMAARVERLADGALESSRAWQSLALLLVAALVGLIAGTMVIVALGVRNRSRATTYHIAPPPVAPALDDPAHWPESRARHRALIEARQEVER